MEDIKKFDKNENGEFTALIPRVMTEDEIIQAKETFNSLTEQYDEITNRYKGEIKDIEEKLNLYSIFTEEEPIDEELEEVAEQDTPNY